MNTKSFAQESRRILMKGVAKKLLFWGFSETGEVLEQPQKISGGYSFRGEVFNDSSVTDLWNSLQTAIINKGVEVVIEEAAYTWFNRIMALRILVKNGYEEPQLENAKGLDHTPVILQKARQGKSTFLTPEEKNRLQKTLTDYSKDQESFAILIKGYCHSHKTLQRVFGKIDDYTELLLPDNMLQADGFLHLLNTTDAISDDEYQKVELIGWLYQFYISEKKDEVFASFKKKKKAEAKDIPAATQIFTPNWIVKYMVENTAGKIWLDKHPNSALKTSMKYLVENESDVITSDSEAIYSKGIENASLINSVEDLTLIDPAAGSGHILVEGFDLIYKMYLEEYYTPEEAVESILKNNLFGLDIDDRAAQLATFAILLKAAKVYPAIWKKDWLPNVYAMPEAEDFSIQEIKDFLGEEGLEYLEEVEVALRLMKQAKNLGSVMKLIISEEARVFIESRYKEIQNTEFRDFTIEVVFQKITNYIPVLLILTKKYTSVVANPPYMGQKNMNADLKNYVNVNYPLSKSDLCTVFIEVLPNYCSKTGKYSFIVPPSWMFLSSFEGLRNQIVEKQSIDSMIYLSRGVFGADFGSVAVTISNNLSDENTKGTYLKLIERTFQEFSQEHLQKLFILSNNSKDFKFNFSRYSKSNPIIEHSDLGLRTYFPNVKQSDFDSIEGSPFAFWVSEQARKAFLNSKSFESIGKPRQGLGTTDNGRFVREWSEVNLNKIQFDSPSKEAAIDSKKKWFNYNKGGGFKKWFGSVESVINWEEDGREIRKVLENKNPNIPRSESLYFKKGITWGLISSGYFSCRRVDNRGVFDVGGSMSFPSHDIQDFLLGFLNSKLSKEFLNMINPTMNYQVGDIKRLPIKYEGRSDIPRLSNQSVIISKNDWDSRETSWDFELSPVLNNSSSLKEAYATWESRVTKDFFQLHSNEEELNRIFIDIYGLQDELTPDVALKDITILQSELNGKDLEKLEATFRENGANEIALPINKSEVISQFISYAIGLFMGRYRLDKKGLNIAHPNPTVAELESYTYNNGKVIIDEDAILPIMGTACNFPDDALQQIYNLLDVIWGAETRTENINFIQGCLNKELEKFLVADFYKYHCKMYKKKPIYWLFSSKKGAFQVLVYMHRMNAFTVEKIRANYLLEHIKNIESEISLLHSNEANLNTQEAKRLDQLRKNLQDCYDYDVELKDMADKQITFDLDDGVTVNYKKFESVVAKIK
jgi:hypothetical protein